MDSTYTAIFALHVVASTLGLAAMVPALLAKKGGRAHTTSGRLFSRGMTVSAATGALLALAWVAAPAAFRSSEPPSSARLSGLFLVTIGALTVNAVTQGLLALERKRVPAAQLNARHLTSILALAALALVSLAVGVSAPHPLSLGYGLLGLAQVARDLAFVLRPVAHPRAYLQQHIQSMGTACIAAVTAFLVLGGRRLLALDIVFGDYAWVLWVLPGAIMGPLFHRAAAKLAPRRKGGAPAAVPDGTPAPSELRA